MDDLISRQIAQKLFGKALTYQEQQGKLTWTTSEVKQWVADFIEDLPSAQPQRTGKWIPQDHNKRAGNISTCVYYYPICSKCGKVGNETYKYCPHCGAKMEGDAE